ncbi:uncharacterized protein J3D65DRAFT_399952 [Phyllosticta citribraziliensis]|uniref:Uncharacterized protein n=1 Tax=Phyllosticta citribraziliensis TaxID=989973 RepID=A0ABR1LMX4_9PEZI
MRKSPSVRATGSLIKPFISFIHCCCLPLPFSCSNFGSLLTYNLPTCLPTGLRLCAVLHKESETEGRGNKRPGLDSPQLSAYFPFNYPYLHEEVSTHTCRARLFLLYHTFPIEAASIISIHLLVYARVQTYRAPAHSSRQPTKHNQHTNRILPNMSCRTSSIISGSGSPRPPCCSPISTTTTTTAALHSIHSGMRTLSLTLVAVAAPAPTAVHKKGERQEAWQEPCACSECGDRRRARAMIARERREREENGRGREDGGGERGRTRERRA